MAEHRTRAIVLRTFDYGESDRLVHLYTEHVGRVSAIAKGARRSRRRFPGRLEIFSRLRVHLVDPPRAALMRLEGAELERGTEGFTCELGRYAVGCQLLELLDRFTGERESNPELFAFASGVLGVIESDQADRLLALLVLCKTLARLGYRPLLATCAVCSNAIGASAGRVAFVPRHGGSVCARCAGPDDARVAAGLLLALEAGIRRPLRERAELGLTPHAVRQAEELLDRFFRFHLGCELRTSDFARKTLRFRRLDADGPDGNTAPSPLCAGESPHAGTTGARGTDPERCP